MQTLNVNCLCVAASGAPLVRSCVDAACSLTSNPLGRRRSIRRVSKRPTSLFPSATKRYRAYRFCHSKHINARDYQCFWNNLAIVQGRAQTAIRMRSVLYADNVSSRTMRCGRTAHPLMLAVWFVVAAVAMARALHAQTYVPPPPSRSWPVNGRQGSTQRNGQGVVVPPPASLGTRQTSSSAETDTNRTATAPAVTDGAPQPARTDQKSFWETTTGFFTAVAGLVTAVAGLIAAVRSRKAAS